MEPTLTAYLNRHLSERLFAVTIEDDAVISPTADFSSNDYMSLTKDPALRQIFLERLSLEPNVLGATGSRLLDGNTPTHLALEARLKHFYTGPGAAAVFNSGYDANLSVFSTLPQKGDAFVFDELIHASIRDGMFASRARDMMFPFSHNSITSLEATLTQVMKDHPHLAKGNGTIFIAVESLYSMDGDFAPLSDIVRVMHETVPPQSQHLIIDEAHTTGNYGAGGRGYVSALGLEDYVHTRIHTFSKALAFGGAVVITSPLNHKYLMNFARPMLFATALPICNIIGIDCIHSWISSERGRELSDKLNGNAIYFLGLLVRSLHGIPTSLLCPILTDHTFRAHLPSPSTNSSTSTSDLTSSTLYVSPVFPIKSSQPVALAVHLRAKGYWTRAMPFPVVDRGQERVRICVRAEHTHDDMDQFVGELVRWARGRMAAAMDVPVDRQMAARL